MLGLCVSNLGSCSRIGDFLYKKNTNIGNVAMKVLFMTIKLVLMRILSIFYYKNVLILCFLKFIAIVFRFIYSVYLLEKYQLTLNHQTKGNYLSTLKFKHYEEVINHRSTFYIIGKC